MLGTVLFHLNAAIQRAAAPIRYWRSRRTLRRYLAPLNRQEEEARRRHGRVEHIRAAKTALIHDALRRV